MYPTMLSNNGFLLDNNHLVVLTDVRFHQKSDENLFEFIFLPPNNNMFFSDSNTCFGDSKFNI